MKTPLRTKILWFVWASWVVGVIVGPMMFQGDYRWWIAFFEWLGVGSRWHSQWAGSLPIVIVSAVLAAVIAASGDSYRFNAFRLVTFFLVWPFLSLLGVAIFFGAMLAMCALDHK